MMMRRRPGPRANVPSNSAKAGAWQVVGQPFQHETGGGGRVEAGGDEGRLERFAFQVQRHQSGIARQAEAPGQASLARGGGGVIHLDPADLGQAGAQPEGARVVAGADQDNLLVAILKAGLQAELVDAAVANAVGDLQLVDEPAQGRQREAQRAQQPDQQVALPEDAGVRIVEQPGCPRCLRLAAAEEGIDPGDQGAGPAAHQGRLRRRVRSSGKRGRAQVGRRSRSCRSASTGRKAAWWALARANRARRRWPASRAPEASADSTRAAPRAGSWPAMSALRISMVPRLSRASGAAGSRARAARAARAAARV